MSPEEREQLRALFGEVVDEKLRPVTRRLDALEKTDREHDRQHRDHQADIRRTQSEVELESSDSLLAASRHISGAIEGVRTQAQENYENLQKKLDDEIVQRARGAEVAAVVGATAAVKTESAMVTVAAKTVAVAADAEHARQDASKAKKWSQYGPLITVVAQAIIAAIMAAYQK